MGRCVHDGQQIPGWQRAGGFRFTGAHKQTDDFISLLMQQDGRSGAVNSTTHCQDDSFCHRSTTLILCFRLEFFTDPAANGWSLVAENTKFIAFLAKHTRQMK
jgi:hypothetical protein